MRKTLLPCMLAACLLLAACGDREAQPVSRPGETSAAPESAQPSSAAGGLEESITDSGVWEYRDGSAVYMVPGTDSGSPSSVPMQRGAFTDSLGTDFPDMPENPRVVALYGSYAETWLLAGGGLCGVTKDALEERELGLPEDTALVGTVKEPNAEAIIALEPELVLLNPDIAGQMAIKDVLESAGLACACFRVDSFDDYDSMMFELTGLTGRDDLYEKNVVRVREQIYEAKTTAALSSSLPDVLLMRAFSTGIKAKTDDELAGAILKDLHAHNIADDHPSMLEDLSLEEVIEADPDFIFVTTMGDEGKALAYLDSLIAGNPAWAGLTAVQEGRYIVLPKDLFHYKPNNRWGESYAYLGEALYPALFENRQGQASAASAADAS